MMRVYIAGPIAGKPDGNRAAFAERAMLLERQGYVPVNPHEVDHSHPGLPCIGDRTDRADDPHLYGCYLRADIMVLMTCGGYTLLPGWGMSKGARTEHAVARAIGLPLIMGASRPMPLPESLRNISVVPDGVAYARVKTDDEPIISSNHETRSNTDWDLQEDERCLICGDLTPARDHHH